MDSHEQRGGKQRRQALNVDCLIFDCVVASFEDVLGLH